MELCGARERDDLESLFLNCVNTDKDKGRDRISSKVLGSRLVGLYGGGRRDIALSRCVVN